MGETQDTVEEWCAKHHQVYGTAKLEASSCTRAACESYRDTQHVSHILTARPTSWARTCDSGIGQALSGKATNWPATQMLAQRRTVASL